MVTVVGDRGKRIAVWVIAFSILLPGAYGFLEKLLLFVLTLESDQGGAFTLFPLANYLMVTLGMVCLLAWGVAHGMFRDVEKPKFTMLDQELALDRRDGIDESQEGK